MLAGSQCMRMLELARDKDGGGVGARSRCACRDGKNKCKKERRFRRAIEAAMQQKKKEARKEGLGRGK
jgi:hypothetical protein